MFQRVYSLLSLFLLLSCEAGGFGSGLPGAGNGSGSGGVPGGSDDVVSVGYQGPEQIHTRACVAFDIELFNVNQNLILATEDIDIDLQLSGSAVLYEDPACQSQNTDQTLTVSQGSTSATGYLKSLSTGNLQMLYQATTIQTISFTKFTQSFANNFDNTVYAVATASDGSLYVVGAFTSLSSSLQSRLTKLKVDGSIDQSFDTQGGFTNTLYDVVIVENQVMVAGDSFTFQNVPNINWTVVLENGLRNPDVDGIQTNNSIRKVLLGSQQGFLLGNFTNVLVDSQSTFHARITSFLQDGHINEDFDPGQGFNAIVRDAVLDASGNIIACGDFTTYDGDSANGVVRIQSDGTIDTSFTTSLAGGTCHGLALASDGKIYVGGNFSTVNGTARSGIARLLSSGNLDPSFAPQGVNAGATVYALHLGLQGRIYAGGDFTTVNGQSRQRLVALDNLGNLDNNFNIGTGLNAEVRMLESTDDQTGDLWVGGSFTQYKGQNRRHLMRLQSSGDPD